MPDDRSAAVPLSMSVSAPARHQWRQLEVHALFPKEAQQAVELIAQFSAKLTELLNITKAALEVAKTLALLASADPLELALRTILKEIEALIDALLGETTAHALMVPIQKQYYGLGDPLPSTLVAQTEQTPNYSTLVSNNAFPLDVIKSNTPDTITFINDSNGAYGGNGGYYQAIISSLSDQGDYARPDFPYNFAVTGVSVIFGSRSLTDIYRIVAIIGRIIDLGFRSDLTARTQPTPTGLKARIMPEPTLGRIGVILDWDPVPPLVIKPLLSAEAMVIKEIFVIRSTNAILRERFAWGSSFPTQPSDNKADLPSTSDVQVIARLTNDGFRSRYTDTDTALKVDTVYYYALSLRYSINGVVQPMSNLSNCVRVFYTQFPGSSRTGVPPDWFATPSLYQLFPILRTLVSQATLFIESMLNRTASNNGIINMIEQTIATIEALIAQAEKWIEEFNKIIAILRDLAISDIGGIYATSFSVPKGGIMGWTSELARRLSNQADTSRPPFDEGELTAGFVLVAGAPNFSELVAFAKLVKLFFGGDEASAAKKATDAFIAGRLGSTSTPLVATQTVFNKDMSPEAAPSTPSTTVSKAKPVFDTTMQPATKLDNC